MDAMMTDGSWFQLDYLLIFWVEDEPKGAMTLEICLVALRDLRLILSVLVDERREKIYCAR